MPIVFPRPDGPTSRAKTVLFPVYVYGIKHCMYRNKFQFISPMQVYTIHVRCL